MGRPDRKILLCSSTFTIPRLTWSWISRLPCVFWGGIKLREIKWLLGTNVANDHVPFVWISLTLGVCGLIYAVHYYLQTIKPASLFLSETQISSPLPGVQIWAFVCTMSGNLRLRQRRYLFTMSLQPYPSFGYVNCDNYSPSSRGPRAVMPNLTDSWASSSYDRFLCTDPISTVYDPWF